MNCKAKRTKRKTRYTALSLLCIVFLVACNREKRRDVLLTQEDTAIEVGKEVEILYSDSALVRVRVTAPVLHNVLDRENPRQQFPNGIRVDFFDANLNVFSVLTAKTATREPEKAIVTARDSVVLTTAKNEKLETEELIWDERAAMTRTDKFVKVTKPGEVIYGYGLEATQDFSYWKIIVPKGRIQVKQVDEAVK
jgi:LPS export ABC transporter protein LptC